MAEKSRELDFGSALLAGGREGLCNVLIFQLITHVVPALTNVIGNVAKTVVRRRIENQIAKISCVSTRQRSSSLRLYRTYDKEPTSNTLVDAVIAHVSELPQTKHVKRTPAGIFVMATDDEIEVSPAIYVKKVSERFADDKLEQLVIDVFSYEYDLTTLRKFLEDLEVKYNMSLANQLGKNTFYFDEIPFVLPMTLEKIPDLSKAPKNIVFSSFVLHTNKSLKNLYGDAVKLIRKRVQFFLNNKRWYEEKGVPYTLGLLLHGVPGAGKTSTIKSIAKDTNRHVLNIRLTQNTTITQLNSLFFSAKVHVVQDGVNKIFDIPIDKRIIVLEDVDCLTDVVLDRELQKQQSSLSTTIDNKCSEKINLSTILNILDGVLEQPGRIIIMTSNHPEKLDKALLRPGRIDVVVKFERCKRHEIKELIEALADKHVSVEETKSFVEDEYTPAEVSQIVFECIEDYDLMIARLSKRKPPNIDMNTVNTEIKTQTSKELQAKTYSSNENPVELPCDYVANTQHAFNDQMYSTIGYHGFAGSNEYSFLENIN